MGNLLLICMKALPHLYITHTIAKGRGVFTGLDIPAGSLIEICPLILIPVSQTPLIDQTEIYNYYFKWDQEYLALALGFGSIYNHSEKPNARVIYDFDTQEIQIESILDINAGDEITINYLDEEDPNHTLWFENNE